MKNKIIKKIRKNGKNRKEKKKIKEKIIYNILYVKEI